MPIRTSGDRIQDRPLAEIGGKGLFTKEIEEALLAGRIDLAVHSCKDMATYLPRGPGIAASCRARIRATPSSRRNGADSPRCRRARARLVVAPPAGADPPRCGPISTIVPFRGNVADAAAASSRRAWSTRTLLALAGLRRLGLEHVATAILPLDDVSAGAGRKAPSASRRRIGDARIGGAAGAASTIAETAVALACERAFLAALDGSCRTPIAGHARIEGGRLSFHGLVITPDGTRAHEIRRTGLPAEAAAIGHAAGAAIREEAGPDFFEGWN